MYKQFPHNPLTNLSRTFYKSMWEKWLDVLLYAHEHKCSSLFWCPKNVRENQIQIISMATRGIYILTNCIQKIFAPVLFSPLSPSFWAFWANSIVSLSLFNLNCVWANSRRDKTVCSIQTIKLKRHHYQNILVYRWLYTLYCCIYLLYRRWCGTFDACIY